MKNKQKVLIIKENDSRPKIVKVSNVITQKGRTTLPTQSLKMLMYIISQVDFESSKLEYRLKFNEFVKACGIQANGTMYNSLKASLQALRSDSWWIINDKEQTLVSWVRDIKIITGSEVSITLYPEVVPYLSDLKSNYTMFALNNTLDLPSTYAIRLYIALKSYEWLHKWVITIAEFRSLLALEKKTYDSFGQIRRVLEKCIMQINEHTDLFIKYKDDGRPGVKTKYVAFVIGKGNSIQDVPGTEGMTLEEWANAEAMAITEAFEAAENNDSSDSKSKKLNSRELVLEFQKQVNYNSLILNHPLEIEMIDGLIKIAIDMKKDKNDSIMIGKTEKSKEDVIKQLSKISEEHIELILDILKSKTGSIGNLNAYCKAVIYNAPMELERRKNYKERYNNSFHNFEERDTDYDALIMNAMTDNIQ